MKEIKMGVLGSVPPQILSSIKAASAEAKKLLKNETCLELTVISKEEFRKLLIKGEITDPVAIDTLGRSMHFAVIPEVFGDQYTKFLPNGLVGVFLHEFGHPELNSVIGMPSDRSPIYKEIARNRGWNDAEEGILKTIKGFTNDILDQWVDSSLISQGFGGYLADKLNWITPTAGDIAETEAKSPESATLSASKIARAISLENLYSIGLEKQKYLEALKGITSELECAFTQATGLFEDIPNYPPSIDNLIVFTHNLINRFEIYVQKKKYGRSIKLVDKGA